MIVYTNGYIVERLKLAAENQADKDHAEADEYYKKFRAMETTFFAEVHPSIDVGLAISETQIAQGSVPNIFTGHGSSHISDLIKSMDKLTEAIVQDKHNELTILEAYILLCAAHVHDAANVEKREDHPAQCRDTLKKYKTLFAPIAIQQIYNVASVHGGKHEEFGKDTFRGLNEDNTNSPRLPLLAALLKLGDELSESPSRVHTNVLEKHEHSERSKLANAYAKSFASFELRQETLFLTYNVYPNERNLKVIALEGPSTFWDFLEYKINVLEDESRYCSQYGRPMLNISKLSIIIRTYKDELPSPVDSSLRFELSLIHGYPDTKTPLCQRSLELSEKKFECLADCFRP